MKNPIVLLCAICLLAAACRSTARYPIAAPSATATDDRVIGKWKLVEDTNHLNFYEVYKGYANHTYHIRFWNRGGANPTYEADVHFSDVEGTRFLNLPYINFDAPGRDISYFFLKLAYTSPRFDTVVVTPFTDTTMRQLASSQAVHMHIAAHANDSRYFKGVYHFFRVE